MTPSRSSMTSPRDTVTRLFLCGGQTRDVSNTQEERSDFSQKCEAIALHSLIVRHHHDVVEKIVEAGRAREAARGHVGREELPELGLGVVLREEGLDGVLEGEVEEVKDNYDTSKDD